MKDKSAAAQFWEDTARFCDDCARIALGGAILIGTYMGGLMVYLFW
jgi:hypothetical protein